MIFMKIREFLLAKHHGKFLNRTFFNRILSIMEVNKLPWLQKKEYQE